MNKKVAFFYPAENIGGAQILFCRIGEYLLKKGFDIIIIDFGCGFISSYFNEFNLMFKHVVIEKNSLSSYVMPDGFVLVVPLSYVYYFNKYLSMNDSKIFFWDLHPNNLIDHTCFSYFYKNQYPEVFQKTLKLLERKRINKISKFLNEADSKKSLFFMCNRNFMSNMLFFNTIFEPSFLPIPISAPVTNDYSVSVSFKFQNEINIGWLSRLEVDKVNILNLLILDLERYSSDTEDNIFLHIIGGGGASEVIFKSKKITIIKKGEMSGGDLSEYIKKYLDVSFAMGTSALEFAIRGVPSVLVPSSTLFDFFKSKKNKYAWLHDIKGFDVATEAYHHDAVEISNIFFDLKKYNTGLLGQRSKEYVDGSHNIDKVGEAFIERLILCKLTFKDLEVTGVYENSFFNNIFLALKSVVKNIRNHL